MLVDADTGVVKRVVVLQYNPDTLTRSLQVQGAGAEGGDRLDALRLKGPPVETIKFDAEIDATDQLEHPDQHPTAAENGIHAELAALETIVYPPSSTIQSNQSLAAVGTLEILPVQAPLTLFVWSATRVVPVRITEFSITEEAFDPELNPLRAKVSLGLRVLNVNDLPGGHRGSSIYLAYQRQKERLAGLYTGGAAGIAGLGLKAIP